MSAKFMFNLSIVLLLSEAKSRISQTECVKLLTQRMTIQVKAMWLSLLYEFVIDRRSYTHNLSSCEIQA